MKKPTPFYMFTVLISLLIVGFALFVIFIDLGNLGFVLPSVSIFWIVGFFMFIAKKLNTGQFAEKLQSKKVCYKCQESIPSDSEFCPKCGANLVDEVECDYCGNLNFADADVCENCKANLK